jgi:hypothetical protein
MKPKPNNVVPEYSNQGWTVKLPDGQERLFKTNEAAWRWIDRQTGSPISRAEVVSDWIWHKGGGGL